MRLKLNIACPKVVAIRGLFFNPKSFPVSYFSSQGFVLVWKRPVVPSMSRIPFGLNSDFSLLVHAVVPQAAMLRLLRSSQAPLSFERAAFLEIEVPGNRRNESKFSFYFSLFCSGISDV